jgi:predicted DNA-binding antitoxin AbrB/MazE fold protein
MRSLELLFGVAPQLGQSYAVKEGRAMTRVTEAVYSKGVLKPADDLGLHEEQRVRLIVETVDEKSENRAAAIARLKAGIAKMQFFSQGPLPSREELHDRS